MESKIPGNGRLFLFYHPNEPGVLTFSNVYRPALRIKPLESLQAYLDWWNGYSEYQLRLDMEQNWLVAEGRLRAADWDKITPLLRRFLLLWEMDVLNMMILLVGIADLDAARSAKLQCFNGDQEDT